MLGYTSKILRYNSETSTWTSVGDMLENICGHTAIPFNITSHILKNYC